MTIADIAAQRLHNQRLLKNLNDPVEVVHWLGAVQSQDFVGAKWALGLRCITTDAEVGRLFNEGRILRTHILRPTWHFVAPEDIRWMQELTAPRVKSFMAYYNRKLGLDDKVFDRGNNIIVGALRGGKHLTRTELAEALRDGGIPATGQKLAHLVGNAELEGITCSGAMKGKQHTYALLAERAPQAKSMPRDKALAELTRRYFASHGPAQVADFAWWSSLTAADIKKGIELAKLQSMEVDGKTYYFAGEAPVTIPSPIVHLLPNYDEYFISYKDRTAFSIQREFKLSRKPDYADLSYHLVSLDGQLVGGWKRDITSKSFTIQLNLFGKLKTDQNKALKIAAKRLSGFAGLPVKMN